MPVTFSSLLEDARTHKTTWLLSALALLAILFPLTLAFLDYPKHKGIFIYLGPTLVRLAHVLQPTLDAPIPPWLRLVVFHVAIVGVFWFFLGRDRPGKGIITPNEELLEDISPYEAGALLAQGPNYSSFAGMILDLVERGVLLLEREDGGTYLSFRLRRSFGPQPVYGLEGGVIKRLFTLSLSYNSDDGAIPTCVFRRNADEVKRAYGFFEMEMYKRLYKRGWYSGHILAIQVLSITILAGWTEGIYLLLQSYLVDPHLQWIYAQILLSLPFLYFMPRLTKAGALAREQVKGLAWYIRVAEKDRLQFHEHPQRLMKKPEELLPYAVALNIDKNWERLFLAGYKKISADPSPYNFFHLS